MNAKPQKHISDYLNNDGKQMKLAIQLVSGYGGEFQSWRLSESDANSYTNIDTYIDMAKTAEKGKIHTLFIADTPSFGGAGAVAISPVKALPFRWNLWSCYRRSPMPRKKSASSPPFRPPITCRTTWLVS